MRISIHFLISETLGENLLLIWPMVSDTSCACFIVFRDFMMRTIADYMVNMSVYGD